MIMLGVRRYLLHRYITYQTAFWVGRLGFVGQLNSSINYMPSGVGIYYDHEEERVFECHRHGFYSRF
jgi:hypothetical protein